MLCHAEVITQQPEGTLKYYQRTGGLTYINNSGTLVLQNQSGFTEVVISNDGHKAWIKNPIAGFFPEGSDDVAWIAGELTDNGTKIKVNLNQQVFYDENHADYLLLALMKKDKSAHTTAYVVDPTPAQATYTVDGETISLDGTSEDYVLGLVWSSDKTWAGFADYLTVYTEYEVPEPVTPPAGLEAKIYPLSAIEYMNEVETIYTSEVKICIDNNDVYLQGIDKFIPAAWIKGTLDGSTITFPIQYIGTDSNERRHFLTSWKIGMGGVDDVHINYYKSLDAFESSAPILINSNPTMNNYYAYYRSLYIGERPAMVELPEGAEPRNMTMLGKMDDTGFRPESFSRVVQMAEVDGLVYIKGLSQVLPEAWTIAETKGNELVIPSGTFVGFSEESAVYLHGADVEGSSKPLRDDIRFTIDAENDSYTCNHVIYECSSRVPRSYIWEYSPGLKIFFDANAPTGADPDDLEQVSYIFSGKVAFSKDALYTDGDFSRKVTMAFDGNLVYVKGLSLECPDGWLKGEMLDNVVAIKCPQLQGQYNGTDISICGFDMMGWENTDLSMSYDPASKTFTLTQDLTVSKDPTNVGSYSVWISKNATLSPDPSGIGSVIEDEATSNPVIYNLQGIPVQGTPSTGIYIVNGKKIYIK